MSGMTAGRHIAVSIFSPNGVFLSYTDNTMGQINFQAKETGTANLSVNMIIDYMYHDSTFKRFDTMSQHGSTECCVKIM